MLQIQIAKPIRGRAEMESFVSAPMRQNCVISVSANTDYQNAGTLKV